MALTAGVQEPKMPSTHEPGRSEPLRALEPENLLEPLDWTRLQSAGRRPREPDSGARVPPQQLEDRMILDYSASAPPPSPRRPGRRLLLAATLMLAVVTVGFAAGAGLPQFVSTQLAGNRIVADKAAVKTVPPST